MNPILRNVLALIAGALVGGTVNMGIVMGSGSIIPPPEGIDPGDMESLVANFHLFSPNISSCHFWRMPSVLWWELF